MVSGKSACALVNEERDKASEIKWTDNKTIILFSDESAFKDRKEAARIAETFIQRITR